MRRISLCCLGINENAVLRRGSEQPADPQTRKGEKGVGPPWCHPADGWGIFRLWSRWQSTYQRLSRVIVVPSSSLHHIETLCFSPSCSPFYLPSVYLPSAAIVLMKLLYRHRSADQMLAAFFLFTLKKNRRKRLLMEVEQSAWGTADSCQQHLAELRGVSTFFGYLHIYCPQATQDLTA